MAPFLSLRLSALSRSMESSNRMKPSFGQITRRAEYNVSNAWRSVILRPFIRYAKVTVDDREMPAWGADSALVGALLAPCLKACARCALAPGCPRPQGHSSVGGHPWRYLPQPHLCRITRLYSRCPLRSGPRPGSCLTQRAPVVRGWGRIGWLRVRESVRLGLV